MPPTVFLRLPVCLAGTEASPVEEASAGNRDCSLVEIGCHQHGHDALLMWALDRDTQGYTDSGTPVS